MHSLAPIAGINLGLRIEGHAEPPGIEAGHRFAEVLAASVGGVAVRGRVGHRTLGGGHDRRVGGSVGVADAQADDIHARRLLGGDLPLQLGEQIWRDLVQTATGSHAAPR